VSATFCRSAVFKSVGRPCLERRSAKASSADAIGWGHSPGNLGAPEKSDANHLYCPRGDCTLKVGNNLHTTRNTLPHLITNG
jgi:hypothetical protein